MNTVIIGGGISGLYAAYKLIKKHPLQHVTILEANNRLGGRVHTIKNKSFSYEGGAARFSQNHKLLIDLIKELNLSDNIFPMNIGKIYIKDTTPLPSFNEEFYIKKLEKAASARTLKELKSKTLLIFMREVLLPSEVDDLIYAFGYQSEFEVCNAYYGIKSLKTDFMAKIKHFGFKGGLSTIVDKLKEYLENAGVKILTNWVVQDINPKSMIVSGINTTIKADRFIICVTKDKLILFKSLIDYDPELASYVTNVISQPLYRIYAKFPTKSTTWFEGLDRICTNNALRQIIPINSKTGLIMISYTDGSWARIWKQFSTKKTLQKEIMKHLRLLFPDKAIPDPEWIDAIYWDTAVHYPGPNYKTYNQPHKDKYIICGEMIVPDGWIEGALSSVVKYMA